MAVKIRLRRMGSKKNPFYRIVVADSRSPRDGKFIEEIGYYNPLTEPITLKVDNEKAIEWIKKGAKPTDVVNRLFNNFDVYGNYTNSTENNIETEEVISESVEEVAVEETETTN